MQKSGFGLAQINQLTTDVAARPTSADLAASSGSSLVGDDGTTVADRLASINLADYTALRAYAGSCKRVRVTGYLATSAPSGIAGDFVVDDSDTTSADNGGTIIVASNGKRWKRTFDGSIQSSWFLKADGATDDAAAWAKAVAAAAGRKLVVTGTVGTKSTLAIPNGVNIDCCGTITALSGFIGSYVVSTDASVTYSKGTVNGLRIDGGGQSIKGLYVRSAQTCFFNDTFVSGCLNTGIHVVAGYEVFFNRFQVVGQASGMTASAPGLLAAAGDCHYSDGVVTLYPIGVTASGGNGHFTRIHPWGVYTVGSTPMLHGFLVTGEGNTFTDCTPDSPDLADRAQPASKTNGGYGIYVDTTAVNTKTSGCKLIVASNANAPVAKLYFGYVGAAFCGFVNGNYDDNSGGAIAGTLQYASTTVQRATDVFGGALSTNKFWTDGTYGTFTPNLNFGGVEISTAGGTYVAGRRTGYYFRIGPMIFYAIHIRISAKGAATGAVTVSGLPFSYVDFGNSQAWAQNGQMANPGKSIVSRLFVNTSSLPLYDAATGTQLADTDIGINQEFYLSGSYPIATGP